MKALLLALVPCTALARPPAPGSSSAIDLAPYGPWIHNLQIPGQGTSCCDLSDCREVVWRIGANGYEAFIDSEIWPEGTDSWELVPPSAVIPPPKRGPIAVACWAFSHFPRFLCFSPGLED